MMKFKVKGIKEAEKFFRKGRLEAGKAAYQASKKVGFKYFKKMASEVAKGKPGGKPHEPMAGAKGQGHLSEVQKRFGQSKRKGGRPIAGGDLGKHIRTHVSKHWPYDIDIGLLRQGLHKASRDDIERAGKMEKGSRIRVKAGHREHFGKYGSPKLTWSSKKTAGRSGARTGYRKRGGKVYTLKKETNVLVTPKRPIISKFLKAYNREMLRDWDRVFFAVMDGKKIYL